MQLRSLTINRARSAMLAIVLVTFVVLVMAVLQFIYVENAHGTFQNYYAFRGCQQLLSKTDTDAACKLSNGKVTRLVQFDNRWYLNGDLPVCYFGKFVCL